MSMVTINDSNYTQHLNFNCPSTGHKTRGCIPRNYSIHPKGGVPGIGTFNIPLIPESEWQSRLDALVAQKAQLSDIRMTGNAGQMVPSRDQNGVGYCWCHSGVSAHLVLRAKMGEPYIDLSPFAVGCMVKGFRDEGGWGSEGIEFEASKGVPTSQFWPQRSMSRTNDNPNTWTNAGLHKYVQWQELDHANMKAQLVSCLLQGFPVVTDFNWWSHSVCTINLVSINPFKTLIWNSWGDTWSDHGMGELEGNKAIPDDAVAAVGVMASAA